MLLFIGNPVVSESTKERLQHLTNQALGAAQAEPTFSAWREAGRAYDKLCQEAADAKKHVALVDSSHMWG